MTSAADIKAADVQKLRQSTGAGLMDCKRALVETGGDFDKAVKLLREQGIAKSAKRADRATGEGLVNFWLSDDAKEGILFELNCETDFVARNEEFIALANTILEQIKANPSWKDASDIPTDPLVALSGKIGEKLSAKRFARFKVSGQGLVASYIHAGAKLGVLIQLDSDKDISGNNDVKELARELALQIAGANPTFVSSSDVPADVIEREKEITKKQMEGQKKPPEILEKIATGKLSQFYSMHCLLEQPHVRDSAGKTKVKDVIAGVGRKAGAAIKVATFARFRVGSD